MSEEHPTSPTPEAPEEPRGEVRGASFLRNPKPYIARLSRRAFLGAALVGLIVLTVLSFRYSRESLTTTSEPTRTPGPPPLSSEQLERLRPPTEPTVPPWELEEASEEAEAQTIQPAPRPRATPKPRRNPSLRNPPLAVSLPTRRESRGREQRGGEGSELTRVADRLARQRQLLGAGATGADTETAATSQNIAPADPRQLTPPEANAVRVAWEAPLTPFVLEAGTYLPAVLTQAVSSEIGGPVRARIARDLLDSATLGHVLIPRGTLALGRQSRQPLLGERRLLIAWERLILPDGRSLELASEPAAHADGTLGARGRVHHRWGQRFGAAALLSVVGAGFQLAQPQRSGFGETASSGQVAAGAVGLELGRLSEEILQKFVDLPPIVSLEPGARVHMLLTRDLAFDHPQP